MRIINLFTKYFFALLLIQGFVAVVLDSISFEHAGMHSACRKARIIGEFAMVLGIVLYILRWIVGK
ncbi:hypothetical protein Z968_00055 [Clostridium novyi A str. 4552]|uniref:Uncharacterized protein n=1 Tax=Clostridium novyi A str. 4552 TaxID=1444289 RepID=A0A0A0IA95_CLONO|nr:CLC_0170 family protein [Clostridium novyi]KGM98379.1 hypothetical protein Z968_00055 [Clostridium novyi A str. 4552]